MNHPGRSMRRCSIAVSISVRSARCIACYEHIAERENDVRNGATLPIPCPV